VLGLQAPDGVSANGGGGGEVSAAETAEGTNGAGEPEATRVSASEDPAPSDQEASE